VRYNIDATLCALLECLAWGQAVGSTFGIGWACKKGVGLVGEQEDFLFSNLLRNLCSVRNCFHFLVPFFL